jgi:hypothetical protein
MAQHLLSVPNRSKDGPETFRFPRTEGERSRLLGSTRRGFTVIDRAPDGGDPDVAGRTLSNPELVAQIERTLESMQARVAEIDRELDGVLKFPGAERPGTNPGPEPTGPRPPAAA